MSSIHDPNDREIVVPEEVPGRPGFYYYPDNKELIVSKDGKVFDLVLNKFLKAYIVKIPKSKTLRQQIMIHRYNNGHTQKSIRYPRILARTFIGRPLCHIDKNYKDLNVNHIDLNALNNNLNNLEWCTCGENNEHSRLNDLSRKDQKAIEIKNIETKEIVNLRSIKQAASYLTKHAKKIEFETISYRLIEDPKGFKFENYLIRYKGCEYNWGDISSECIYRDATPNYRITICIKNISINLEKSFISTAQCAKYLGIERYSFKSIVARNSYKRMTYGNWLIKKSTDKDWPIPDLCILSKILTNDIRAIYLKNKSTNIVEVYPDIYALSDKYPIDIDAVLTSFSNNSPYETDEYVIDLFCNVSPKVSILS